MGEKEGVLVRTAVLALGGAQPFQGPGSGAPSNAPHYLHRCGGRPPPGGVQTYASSRVCGGASLAPTALPIRRTHLSVT